MNFNIGELHKNKAVYSKATRHLRSHHNDFNSVYCVRTFLSLVGLLVFGSNCATNDLIRYEEGKIVSDHQNLKQTILPVKYEISVDGTNDKLHSFLKIKVLQNNQIKEDWEDTYSKIGVYKTQCTEKDTENFSKNTFGNPIGYCELRQPEDGVITKFESRVISKPEPILIRSATLTINNISSTSDFSDGSIEFNFSSFKLDRKKLPHKATATLKLGEITLDISDEFDSFVENEEQKEAEDEANKKKELENNLLQRYSPSCQNGKVMDCVKGLRYFQSKNTEFSLNLYKLLCQFDRSICSKYRHLVQLQECPTQNLFMQVFSPYGSGSGIETDCIYFLDGPLRVIQTIPGGILVTVGQPDYTGDKIIYIQTSRQFADQQVFWSKIRVESLGLFSYNTAFGIVKTVQAFREFRDQK